MSYRPTMLGSQVRLEPETARAFILEKFREAGANLTEAAERMGLSDRTLFRYVRALRMQGQLDALRARLEREGYARPGLRAGS